MLKPKKIGRFEWIIFTSNYIHGLGVMLSFQNPITTRDYYLLEFKILWLKAWIAYFKKQTK